MNAIVAAVRRSSIDTSSTELLTMIRPCSRGGWPTGISICEGRVLCSSWCQITGHLHDIGGLVDGEAVVRLGVDHVEGESARDGGNGGAPDNGGDRTDHTRRGRSQRPQSRIIGSVARCRNLRS